MHLWMRCFLLMLVSEPILAHKGDATRVNIPAAFQKTAARHGIPAEVLQAVARTESGRRIKQTGQFRAWPWTLNVAGTGMVFETRAKACTALRQALRRTRIVDVGIAQLNVRWNPDLFGPGRRFPEPCDGLDPYANLDAAAARLRRHFEATGNWLTAAGRYHRPAGGAPAQRYAKAVAANLTAEFDVRQPLVKPAPSGLPRLSAVTPHSKAPLPIHRAGPAVPAVTADTDVIWIRSTDRLWISSVSSASGD